MATNIDAERLRRILAGETVDGFSLGRGNYVGPQPTEADDRTGLPQYYEDVIYRNLEDPTWGQAVWETYNPDGTYRGIGSGDSDALGLAKFIAMSAAAYGGVNALGGNAAAGGAGTGASFGSEPAFGAGLGEGATLTGGSTLTSGTPVFGTTLADAGIGFGGMGAYAPAAGAVGGALSGTGSATTGGGLSSLVNGAKDVMGSGSGLNVGGLLGAAAGALDSKDSEQKQSRDPWEPAQGFLKQQIAQGQDLSNRYQAQPFSAAQQAAYSNVGGLLDAINANAGGLLGGFNANASGANNFVRGQRPTLTGSQFNLNGFAPGLLGSFGTRG